MAKVDLYRYIWRGMMTSMLLFAGLFASSQYSLQINITDKDSSLDKSKLGLLSEFKNKPACLDYVNRLPSRLQSMGYVAASIDSSFFDSTHASIDLFLGEQLSGAFINTDSVDKKVLEAINWSSKAFEKKAVNFESLTAIQTKILNYMENNGYPFALIFLDSIRLQDNAMYANLKVRQGPLYKIDSIRNMGTGSISNRYLQRYLDILNGSIYRKNNLQSISQKLAELPFLVEKQPYSLSFLGTGSILNLNLEPQRSSQVNVLIGLLPAIVSPNNIYEAPRTKLQFTGEANINLKNKLGNGETISLNWQSLQVKSQRLNLGYQQSYLFGSPFGANMSFDLLKKDSSFITVNILAGLQYSVSSRQSGTVFIQNQFSNLSRVDTSFVKQTRSLPLEADVRLVSIGLQYDGSFTDYRFNPTKGDEWNIVFAAGTKTIKKNSVIVQLKDNNDPAYNYNSLYDTVKLKSFQFRIIFTGAHYFKLNRISTIKWGLNGAWFESPNIYRNELFQIGGYRLLRGFDEESIYASQYLVTTLEYRYLIDKNSYLYVFTDVGWTRNAAATTKKSNSYVGAGLGLALETKAGIFNISFALGKRNDLNLNPRQSKIHFGYVNFF